MCQFLSLSLSTLCFQYISLSLERYQTHTSITFIYLKLSYFKDKNKTYVPNLTVCLKVLKILLNIFTLFPLLDLILHGSTPTQIELLRVIMFFIFSTGLAFAFIIFLHFVKIKFVKSYQYFNIEILELLTLTLILKMKIF